MRTHTYMHTCIHPQTGDNKPHHLQMNTDDRTLRSLPFTYLHHSNCRHLQCGACTRSSAAQRQPCARSPDLLPAPGCNERAQREVGHQDVRGHGLAGLGRQAVRLQPLLDGLPLVGVAVSSNHRAVHELLDGQRGEWDRTGQDRSG